MSSDTVATLNDLSSQVAVHLLNVRQQQQELLDRVDQQLTLLVNAEQEASKKRLEAVQRDFNNLKDALTAALQQQGAVEEKAKAAEESKNALVAKQ
jgi:non-homologous end joining protein Ku